MSRIIAGEYFPEDKYPVQQTIFTLIAIAGGIVLWLGAHRPPPVVPPPLAAPSAGVDRFLLLWMPEVPSTPTQTQLLRVRYAQWLHALAENGFNPLLLSDVMRRYRAGVGLPDHAVVLVFDPGYRHTFETVAPIFMHARIPAVWVIDKTDLRRDERRTIHSHMVSGMQRSSYWDVGFHQIQNDWKFSPSNSEVIQVNNLTTQWASQLGDTALNVGINLSVLNGLHIRSSWTGDDLVKRLSQEWPLQSPAYLTVKPVGHYLWGVVSERPKGSLGFTLHAPLQSTAGSIFWLGTQGCRNFILTADIRALFGETFFWLRSLPDKNEGIGVGLGHGLLFVDLLNGGKRQRLATAPLSLAGSAPLVMRLDGNTLRISRQNSTLIQLDNAAFPDSLRGIIRMTVYDKIGGAATLNVQQLQITPLIKKAF